MFDGLFSKQAEIVITNLMHSRQSEFINSLVGGKTDTAGRQIPRPVSLRPEEELHGIPWSQYSPRNPLIESGNVRKSYAALYFTDYFD